MAGMNGDSFSGAGDNTKSLKSNLRGWRDIFVIASKLLKWEQPYYCGIVYGIISLFFLLIWYLDPSLITGVSMLMMILCICDYIIPFVSPMIFPEANWNSNKEKEFSDACKALSEARASVRQSLAGVFRLKDTNPWLYVAVATVSLSTLAWLGNQMHNLMLLYFMVLILAFIPGLAHHGILKKGATAMGKFGKKHN
ncbi:ADP-ribosylation factor-like protein 6-interacting protein 1 [Clavelina lepadiformis]|uniref:ADP-ribosylation factor-like protein 6-interacting protein 1 n=1 Tax=Clavelina lepadiformis TaxID=159417 RepID=UPI004042C146